MNALLPVYPPRQIDPAPELAGDLSPAELAFAPEAAVRRPTPLGRPAAEVDAQIVVPGHGSIPVTLTVYGDFTRAFRSRDRESPDEPAGFAVRDVYLGEVEILGEIGPCGEQVIASAVMEAASERGDEGDEA